MVDLKINLLPAASPRAFFCSPHTAETCGTWGGGAVTRCLGISATKQAPGQFGYVWVEKLRDFLFEIGQGFLSMAILFADFFWWNRSHFSKGMLLSLVTDGSTMQIFLAGTNWDITKYN